MSDPKLVSNLVPHVVDPKLWPDPKTIKLSELKKYVGLDMMKMGESFKAYRRSAWYLGGTLFGFLVTKMFVDNFVHWHIFGENGNGGHILTMHTKNTMADYTYNRQFQRMRWLTEEPTGDDPTLKVSDSQLIDLGVKVVPKGANPNIRKLVPHDKYLI